MNGWVAGLRVGCWCSSEKHRGSLCLHTRVLVPRPCRVFSGLPQSRHITPLSQTPGVSERKGDFRSQCPIPVTLQMRKPRQGHTAGQTRAHACTLLCSWRDLSAERTGPAVLCAPLICVSLQGQPLISSPASSAPPAVEVVGALTRADCRDRLDMEGLGQGIPLCQPRRGNRAGWLISFRGSQSQSHPGVRDWGGGPQSLIASGSGGQFSPAIFTKDRGPGEAP